MNTCEHCRFLKIISQIDHFGACRRHAPTILASASRQWPEGVWPLVEKYNEAWCGEFAPKSLGPAP